MRSFFLIFSLVSLASCFNKGDCLLTSTNLVKIDLYKKIDGTPNSTKFLIVEEIDNLDTLVISSDTTEVISLELPLNPNKTETYFVLHTTDDRLFQLTLGYSTYTRIIASDCGAYLYYNDLAVKDSNFDSTRLINPQLLISVSKNLRLYY